jgi:lipoate-protein ligase B
MLNLRARRSSPLDYVRALERVVIDTLAELGVEAESEDRPTGVWIGDAKIAAIGVKVSRAVTMHGFALNVDPDLTYFDQIVACGLPEAKATSISRELGRPVTVESAMDSLLPHFERVFEVVTALG